MMTPARIVRLIGIMGLVGWLGMVGWMTKTGQAQNGAQVQPPACQRPKQKVAGKESLPPPPIAPTAVPGPGPAQENSASLSLPKDNGPQAPPPIEPILSATEKAPAMPEPVARAQAAAPPEGLAPGTDDPEQSAQSFVERSQKEAEEHLKALTAEAEQLRSRLAKLDSGIKKWQNLLTALKAAQQGLPALSAALASGAEDPGELEPIKPGTPGPRNDKRVKWASASAGAASTNLQPLPSTESAPPASPVNQPAAAPPAQALSPVPR